MNARSAHIVFLVLAGVAFLIAVIDPNLLDIKWEPTGLLLYVIAQLVTA